MHIANCHTMIVLLWMILKIDFNFYTPMFLGDNGELTIYRNR